MPSGGRRSTTWKPGQGGGGGRPRVITDIREAAKEYSHEALERLKFWAASNHATASPMACIALLDRGYGKPAQRNEHTGADGGPIQTQAVQDDRPEIATFVGEFAAAAKGEVKH